MYSSRFTPYNSNSKMNGLISINRARKIRNMLLEEGKEVLNK